jgi:hypothetical protein
MPMPTDLAVDEYLEEKVKKSWKKYFLFDPDHTA